MEHYSIITQFFSSGGRILLLYGCTSWMLTKRMEKKLDSNYSRMLWVILNKTWRQHPTKQQVHGHQPPITKTIQVRQTRHAGHCWWSRDKIISDVLLWTPSHGRAKVGRPTRTYIQQLSADMGCSPEDQPEAMDDRDGWQEREGHGYSGWWHNMMMMMMYYLLKNSSVLKLRKWEKNFHRLCNQK